MLLCELLVEKSVIKTVCVCDVVYLQAQIVLLGILVIAIVNFLVGTLIPATEDKKAKGFYGYRGK